METRRALMPTPLPLMVLGAIVTILGLDVKRSKYVQCIARGAGGVLVNTLWGTEAEVSSKKWDLWRSVFQDPSRDLGLDKSDITFLLERRMLLHIDIDELQYMRDIYKARRFSRESLGLTIAPTLDCNFACPYCYEDKRPGKMSDVVAEGLVDYVRQMLPGRSSLRVMWYGGEPLICKDLIESLTADFLAIASECGAVFKASMTTNGYLLTPAIVDRLSKFPVWEKIQITLDGTAAYHDRKRPLKSGRETFRAIYSNLIEATKKLPVTLRMNVDNLNWRGCSDLLSGLATDINPKNLTVYFAPIHPYGEGCRDIADSSDVSLVNNKVFSEIERHLISQAQALGFKVPSPLSGKTCQTCQAVSTHSVVVQPDGGLQRCWTEVGESNKSIGKIGEPISLNSDNSLRWLTYDPTSIDPCQSCEVLPQCFGGCPQRHLDGRPIEMICSSIKYQLRSALVAKYSGANDPNATRFHQAFHQAKKVFPIIAES